MNALDRLTERGHEEVLIVQDAASGLRGVIALVSLGRGTQAAINAQIQSIGTNLLFVRPGAVSQGGVRGAQGSQRTLTVEDGIALEGLAGVVAVAPEPVGVDAR